MKNLKKIIEEHNIKKLIEGPNLFNPYSSQHDPEEGLILTSSQISQLSNMDKTLIKERSRKAVKMSLPDFVDILNDKVDEINKLTENSEDPTDIEHFELDGDNEFVIADFMKIMYDIEEEYNDDVKKSLEIIKQDMFVTFGYSHLLGTTEELDGFHMHPKGFPFFGITMAEDNEQSPYFILYYDGYNIRLYIPTYGNTYNINTNTAYGSEGNYLENIGYEYPKYFPPFGSNPFGWTEDDLKIFGELSSYNEEKGLLNGEAIAEDIYKTFYVE